MMPEIEESTEAGKRVFQARSLLPVSLATLTRFHEQSNVLVLLTPPPVLVRMIRDLRVSNTAGMVEFTLWFGPIPVHWLARHEPGPTPTSFIDRMIAGPMAQWEHQHIFHAVAGGVELVDKVTFSHKPGWRGWITRLAFDGVALRFLFAYRHWRTRRACLNLERNSAT